MNNNQIKPKLKSDTLVLGQKVKIKFDNITDLTFDQFKIKLLNDEIDLEKLKNIISKYEEFTIIGTVNDMVLITPDSNASILSEQKFLIVSDLLYVSSIEWQINKDTRDLINTIIDLYSDVHILSISKPIKIVKENIYPCFNENGERQLMFVSTDNKDCFRLKESEMLNILKGKKTWLDAEFTLKKSITILNSKPKVESNNWKDQKIDMSLIKKSIQDDKPTQESNNKINELVLIQQEIISEEKVLTQDNKETQEFNDKSNYKLIEKIIQTIQNDNIVISQNDELKNNIFFIGQKVNLKITIEAKNHIFNNRYIRFNDENITKENILEIDFSELFIIDFKNDNIVVANYNKPANKIQFNSVLLSVDKDWVITYDHKQLVKDFLNKYKFIEINKDSNIQLNEFNVLPCYNKFGTKCIMVPNNYDTYMIINLENIEYLLNNSNIYNDRIKFIERKENEDVRTDLDKDFEIDGKHSLRVTEDIITMKKTPIEKLEEVKSQNVEIQTTNFLPQQIINDLPIGTTIKNYTNIVVGSIVKIKKSLFNKHKLLKIYYGKNSQFILSKENYHKFLKKDLIVTNIYDDFIEVKIYGNENVYPLPINSVKHKSL